MFKNTQTLNCWTDWMDLAQNNTPPRAPCGANKNHPTAATSPCSSEFLQHVKNSLLLQLGHVHLMRLHDLLVRSRVPLHPNPQVLCCFPRFLLVVRRYYNTPPCRSKGLLPKDHPIFDTPITAGVSICHFAAAWATTKN